MRISRVAIKNFRNFKQLELQLADHAVVVGANGVGKSNLLHALRLVLDPSLPDAARQLRTEDFWDGVPRPIPKSERIEISLELTDFEDNEQQLASLTDHLVEPEPMVARLSFVYAAKASSADPPLPEEFEFYLFGGGREENRFGYELRRQLPLDLFHALRDVENDLASWRRSPLRPLLERAWAAVLKKRKAEIGDALSKATDKLTDEAPLEDLATTVTDSLEKVAGVAQATDVTLGIAPTEPEALIRAVRLLFDSGQRAINDTSLGLANLLYFTLKLLELQHLATESQERDHTFVAIEEPEAHLHPHLQRQMFRAFLRIRPHLPAGDEDSLEVLPTTILVTTHSPHLVSIAPLTTLVLLRRETAPGSDSKPVRHTIGSSMASNQLDPTEVADLERYLEVTRAEMLFARGVLLVEGEADLYLVPKIASLHGVDLDKLGVTTCSVGGTHFQSHCVFLRQMGIPFAVVTDGDPTRKVTGEARVKALLKKLLGDKVFGALPPEKHLAKAASEGLFLGQETIELDLLAAGRKKAISRALIDLAPSPTARKRAEEWLADPTTIDSVQVLKDIEEIGKGRFAQRLASSLRAKKNGLNGPQYIVDAIDFIVNRLAS